MFVLIAIAVAITFVVALVCVLLVSVGRAASLVDNPSMDLALPRK